MSVCGLVVKEAEEEEKTSTIPRAIVFERSRVTPEMVAAAMKTWFPRGSSAEDPMTVFLCIVNPDSGEPTVYGVELSLW